MREKVRAVFFFVPVPVPETIDHSGTGTGTGSPEGTALRETEEEVGLPERHIDLVGRLNVSETGTGYRVVPVVGLVTPPFALVPDPNEVADITDIWTFAREVRSRDPNWTLVETSSSN